MVTDSGDGPTAPTTNGMPTLGLGTWENTDPEACAESVATALEVGYRHVDTAQSYDNEAFVGDGIANAAVDREELFLATKVDTGNLAADDVLESTRASLERLGVEYLDLLYVHWPLETYDAEETMAAFADLHDEGLIERVGVSNFEPADLEVAMEACDAPIFANQIECHPLLPQRELREVCDDLGVEVVAYSPLARGAVFEAPEIQAVAEKHDGSEAQVSLAWLREKGVTVIPKSASRDHIRENLESLRLELDPGDVERIDSIGRRKRIIDFEAAPWN